MVSLVIGAFAGVVGVTFLWFGSVSLEVWSWVWPSFLIEGAIAGGLLANLGWVAHKPWQRLRRSAAIAVALNAAVWLLFVLFTPPMTAADFSEIARERARRDADSGLDMVTHEPVIVAGRMAGTYGSIDVMDKPLMQFAGPAIDYTAFFVVPYSYGTANATRRESFTIAAAAFLLSTAFWTAFPPLAGSLIRGGRRFTASSYRRDSASDPRP